MQRNGVVECSVCRSRLVVPSPRSVSRAYDKHRRKISSKFRPRNVLLVGLQPILVFMSKVDGKFQFSPISVNFLTEVMKVIFAIVMLIIQSRKQKVGEKPLLARSTFIQLLLPCSQPLQRISAVGSERWKAIRSSVHQFHVLCPFCPSFSHTTTKSTSSSSRCPRLNPDPLPFLGPERPLLSMSLLAGLPSPDHPSLP